MLRRSITASSLATLAGLAAHFVYAHAAGAPLLTDGIAEWVMARTPSPQALWLLTHLGGWAKPFAATAGLAALGFAVWLTLLPRARRPVSSRSELYCAALACVSAAALAAVFQYPSLPGVVSFWLPATGAGLLLTGRRAGEVQPERRTFLAMAGKALSSTVMLAGVAGVAIESYLRNAALAKGAGEPVTLFHFEPPEDKFGEGLVRKPVTPVGEFYTMSKNTVDPALDPEEWRLKVTVDGEVLEEFRYETLLSLPRTDEYVSLRCVSNNLKSNLMGTALWSGVRFGQLVRESSLPDSITEAAVIGADGHGDSLPLAYAFSRAVLLAIGMNGGTLTRLHGFPVRLVAPRYYGFKHVKWIAEIAFRSTPYLGTWPKMGYTKKPVIHTVSFIDEVEATGTSLRMGGIAMSGHGGIRQVRLRVDDGDWVDAELERPLSPFTWTRWKGEIEAATAEFVEARAMDARGAWQAAEEGPLFPDGVKGPTIRKIS